MPRKKRSKKKNPAHPSLLTPEEESTVTSLLQEFSNTDPNEIATRVPDSRHAQALVEQLCMVDDPSIPLLLALKDGFEDKQVRKAVKRAIFKLKQRGVSVEELLESKSPLPILKPPQEEKPAAYIGPISDTFGSRAVLITLHRTMKGQHIGMGFVSDQDGIYQFLYGAFSKKRTMEMRDHLSKKAGPLVGTSLAHAATILEDAYQRHLELHPDAPSDYLELRPWLLENTSLLDRQYINDFIPEDQVVNKILTDSQLGELFKHKLMEAWLVEFERLRPVMEELIKADDSPIVLTEGQKSDQSKRIKEKCMDELFPDSERALLKRRLEEMAYIFFKLEEETFSRLCLDAARTMDQEDNLLQKNPVIEFLVERSLDFYMNVAQGGPPEDKKPTESSSPSIIIP